MKRQIRFGVFETNSSSVHSLTIVTAEEFEKFKAGDLIMFDKELMTKAQALEKAKKSQWYEDATIESLEDDGELKTFDDYSDEYETYEKSYTTKSGDEIVAFGYYGHD